MRQSQRPNEMIEQWIHVEHCRWHSVEEWPDSPRKEAALAGIHSALERLKSSLAPIEPQQCIVCASRRAESAVLTFPSRPQDSAAMKGLAA
jgi:hypothetical protein